MFCDKIRQKYCYFGSKNLHLRDLILFLVSTELQFSSRMSCKFALLVPSSSFGRLILCGFLPLRSLFSLSLVSLYLTLTRRRRRRTFHGKGKRERPDYYTSLTPRSLSSHKTAASSGLYGLVLQMLFTYF